MLLFELCWGIWVSRGFSGCLHRRHFEELVAGRSNICKIYFRVNCLVVLSTGYALNVILLSICEF